jgi:ABC-type methionine transport system permease subunit
MLFLMIPFVELLKPLGIAFSLGDVIIGEFIFTPAAIIGLIICLTYALVKLVDNKWKKHARERLYNGR